MVSYQSTAFNVIALEAHVDVICVNYAHGLGSSESCVLRESPTLHLNCVAGTWWMWLTETHAKRMLHT